MANIKFGISQINISTPSGYAQFSNAAIIVILPAIAALVQGWGFSTTTTNRVLLILTFVGALIKGIGVFLGSTPSTN